MIYVVLNLSQISLQAFALRCIKLIMLKRTKKYCDEWVACIEIFTKYGMAIDVFGTLENLREKYLCSPRFRNALNDEVKHLINSEGY